MSEGKAPRKAPHPSAPPAPKHPTALEDLDARLRQARAAREPAAPKDDGVPMSGLGQAFRIGTELVAALGVGVGIGLLLDYWLDTGPWFLVVFFFLGAAAGMLNVYRAASGIGLAPGYPQRPDKGTEPGEEEHDGPAGTGRSGN